MKKGLLIILTFILCVSLCSCGQSKEEKIIEELESYSWKYCPFWKSIYTFEDGMCTLNDYNLNDYWSSYEKVPFRSYYGSYSISGVKGEYGTITIFFGLEKEQGDYDYKVVDKVQEDKLYFTYEDDFLRVFWDEELTKKLEITAQH